MTIQLQNQKVHIAPEASNGRSTALTALTNWQTLYHWDSSYTYEAERQSTTPIVSSGLQRYTKIGGERATITFSCPLEIDAADGAADTDLAGAISVTHDLLYKAAGWGATASGNTTVTYDMSDIDAAHSRIAVVLSDGNKNLVLRECLVSPTFSIDPRQMLIVTFEIQGILESFDASSTMPTFPAVGQNTTPPALVRGMTVSINDGSSTDTASEVYGLEINLSNDLLQQEDLTEENGYKEPIIEGRSSFGGSIKLPVPTSGDSILRKNQRNQSEATVTIVATSPWTSSTKPIDVTFTLRPVAFTEVTGDMDAILAETGSYMIQHDLSSAHLRPQIQFRDGRRTG